MLGPQKVCLKTKISGDFSKMIVVMILGITNFALSIKKAAKKTLTVESKRTLVEKSN